MRGPSFRRALRAIAELRAARDATLVETIARLQAPDEQRSVQYRIASAVLDRGVPGLAAEWPTVDARWRIELISEIEQALDLWTEEHTLDLLLVALEDASRDVQAKAVWGLLAVVRDIPARERRAGETESTRRAVAARDSLLGWLTPARRSRASQGLVTMIRRHHQQPLVVLAQVVEVLGYCAEPTDVDARTALESLRSQSGEPFHVSHETVDRSNLVWRERLGAERKGIPADLIRARIVHRPTGLLDQEVLNAALQRIQARARR